MIDSKSRFSFELIQDIPELKNVVLEYRKSRLGQHCKMMYDEHRGF